MRTSLIVAMLLLLEGCSGKREDHRQAPGLSDAVEVSGKTADAIFRASRVIDLETSSESLISFPFDLCVSGGEIFVASRNNEIKVFNMDGKYQRSIGRLGDGPGEYRAVGALFPQGSKGIGVYDWSNLRLTLFSREGAYQMSAVLGMPGMEGVRSVLFIHGSYYIHVPSSPAQNYYVVRLDSSLAFDAAYVEADRRFTGYQDRLLFNGGIVADSAQRCLYEADSYSYGIRRVDLASGEVHELDFKPPSFYVPMPVLATTTSMEEALAFFQKGTNVYNIFLAGGHYLILEYHRSLGRGRISVVYLLYDLENGSCITVPAGTAHPTCADGEHLYTLIYHDKNSKQPDEMVDNPSLVVYTVSVDSL